MKTTDLPLWQQMYSPTGSHDELTELRAALSHSTACRQSLEKFLFAEWASLNALARTELNPSLRQEYQQTATALAEIAGKMFMPERKMTTKNALRV